MPDKFTPRKRVQVECYEMSYQVIGNPGCGYSFPCDKNGVIDLSKLREPALKNLALCMIGGVEGHKISVGKIIDTSYSYFENGTCKCPRCKSTVQLDDAWWNTCDNCGADFDGSGNMLAPRSQWGEETGEVF